MGFLKKAALLGGIPVRPSTKRERAQKATIRGLRESRKQTRLMEQQAQAQAQAWQPTPAPPIPPPPPAGPAPSIADELRKLSDLLHQGVISHDEFEAAKAQLLGR